MAGIGDEIPVQCTGLAGLGLILDQDQQTRGLACLQPGRINAPHMGHEVHIRPARHAELDTAIATGVLHALDQVEQAPG
ncbi:MAG: hypothetical protein AAFN05_03865, partial [Pseudomonadota bacterium]